MRAQAVVFAGADQPLTLRDVDLPQLSGSEVLVRIVACTLCGSDLHTYLGKRSAPVPTVLGHEILGTIEAFGPDAPRTDFNGEPIREGERVSWSVIAHCGECFFCQHQLPQKCTHMVKYGHEALQPGKELTGGLATHCLLAKGSSLIRVPDGLSDAVACPANCATATVAAALDAAEPIVGQLAGKNVLVLGTGMLGVTAAAMARWLGASAVIGCDTSDVRLERARSFGATHLAQPAELAGQVRSIGQGFGVDVLLELTGSPDAFENALPCVRTGGTAILVGAVFPSRAVPLAMEQIVRRQLTLRGVHNYAPAHLAKALRFLDDQHELPFDTLVSHWVPLEEATRAFELAQTPGTFRIGVRPSGH